MKNFKILFENLIEELPESTLFEVKTWLCHNFADVTVIFDENIEFEKHEEYLVKLKKHIDYLEKAYIMKKEILERDNTELLNLFSFDDLKTQELIKESITSTIEWIYSMFEEYDYEVGDITYSEMDEYNKKNVELLSNFLNDVE